MNHSCFYQNPFKILLVDDDIPHRTLEKDILREENYLIREADNGRDALTILKEQEFDAILLGKLKTFLPGDEVCRRIREELTCDCLPIIMVTGTDGGQTLSRSLENGANDFIRKPFSPTELVARVRSVIMQKRLSDQLDTSESLLFALVRMIEGKDKHRGDHCSRLSHGAVVFGRKLGLEDADIDRLRKGGILHDIGKLGIPDEILLKKTPLNPHEKEIIMRHTTIGERLFSGLTGMEEIAGIIRSHHERWNGSGYPDGLAGEEIPFLARVLQIVDIYDSLSHPRSYRKALPLEDVITTLKNETLLGWCDPSLMSAFLEILENQPESLNLPESTTPGRDLLIYEDAISQVEELNDDP